MNRFYFRGLIRQFLCCIALIFLSACTNLLPFKEHQASQNWEDTKKALSAMQSWSLQGRIAARNENESGSASLYWQQQSENYNIRIIAAFGRGSLELEGDAAGVSMRDKEGQLLQAGSPEELMMQSLGWRVPVRGLQYWVRGLPDPNSQPDTILFDDEARISELRQQGWEVSYARYVEVGDLHLPKKLSL